jgi:phosphoribosylglycinamide formyltransferase-1
LNAHQSPSVVVLISGRGSNLRALINGAQAYQVALVLSDVPTAAGLSVARELGIAARAVPREGTLDRTAYDRLLADAIDEVDPSLIVLAGFMRILSPEFIDRYAGRIVNIHPSLLPRHRGLHTHRNALAAGDTVHGATVHFVTAELDGGPPIIQASVAVRADDDEATLAARVLNEEHRIYPLVVDWYCTGRLRCHDGMAWLDGNALSTPLVYDAGMSVRASA